MELTQLTEALEILRQILEVLESMNENIEVGILAIFFLILFKGILTK